MKKIITNNGKFEITNSLYESIKKNNPELLEVVKIPSANINAIASKYKEITGKDYNPDDDESKILSMYVKSGFNIDTFSKLLQKEVESNNKNDDSQNQSINDSNYKTNNIKNTLKNDKDIKNDEKLSEDEIKELIFSETKLSEDEISDKKINDIINAYNDEYEKTHNNSESLDVVGKMIEKIVNKKNNIKTKLKNFENGEEISSGESSTGKNGVLTDPQYSKCFDEFEKHYLSKQSLMYIKDLYNKYCKDMMPIGDEYIINDEDDFDTKKRKCIGRIYSEFFKNDNNIDESLIKSENKIISNDFIKLFEENNENNENDENLNQKIKRYMDESDYAIKLRKLILGIRDDETYNEIKNLYSIKSEEILHSGTDKEKNNILSKRSDISNELKQNEYNLFNYMTEEDWNGLYNTLTLPLQGDTAEEKTKYIKESVKKVINLIDKCSFDTKIPAKIINFLKTVESSVKHRTFKLITCKFNNFGESKPKGWIIKVPQQKYIDMQRNEKIGWKNLSSYKAYQAIPENEFWKNTAYILCRTRESFGIVTAAISEFSRRNEVNISQSIVPTGLNTNTLIYSLYSDDENLWVDGIIKNRNGEIICDKNKMTTEEIEICNRIKRYYFIIVTEGIVRQGELVSKIGHKIGNFIKNNSSNYDIRNLNRVK